MKIAVAGTGYVGLITGVCLASIGHQIVCVDTDQTKIDMLNRGKAIIYEPGLEEMLHDYKSNLRFTTDCQAAYHDSEVVFICVGTPEKKDGSANLKYVYDVAKEIAQSIVKDTIIVTKSTVPIGTNDRLDKIVSDNLASPGVHFSVLSNPEFLSQGRAIQDTLHASRIIIGAQNDQAALLLQKIYEPFGIPFVITDRHSAEMIKYASNDFLALKISYINEISNLCELFDGNIEDVAKGMGLDPRIGKQFLNAGIGYGGSCFPKDTKALHWMASFNDYELKTVKAAIEVNELQKLKPIKKARKYYESFDGLTVAVLGLTFKPDTDDLREAPSLVNIPVILDDGGKIKAWDPVGVDNFKKVYPNQIEYCDTIESTLKGADICFIFTEWEEIRKIDVSKFSALMSHPVVIDGRNCFALKQFEHLGITYESVGRKSITKAD